MNSTAKKVHKVTVDGRVVTRTSHRDYTHACIVKWADAQSRGVYSWHQTQAAADRQCKTLRGHVHCTSAEVHLVETDD